MVRKDLPHDTDTGAARRAWPVALLYGAQFLAIGLSMPLLPVWLQARGLGAEAIGQVLAGQGLARVLGQLLLARLADVSGRLRLVMFASAMLAVAAAGWLATAHGFLALLAGVAITFFLFSPLVPLTEVLAVRAGERLGIAYGRMRLWGSLTFTSGALLAGVLLDVLPGDVLIWPVAAAMLAAALSVLLQPPLDAPEEQPQERPREEPKRQPEDQAGQGRGAGQWRALLTSGFVLFLVVSGLVQASHAMLYGFSALHWRGLGHSGLTIGLLVTAGVLAEVLLFWFSGRLPGWAGPARLLMLGAAASVVRWAGMALDPPLAVLYLLQMLHAFTFGAAHLGAIAFIRSRAPRHLAATAQAIHSSVSMGLFMMLAMWASGQLYAAYGARAWLAMAGMAALAVPLADLLRRVMPPQRS